MSRHQVPGKDHPSQTVFVGWDPPLSTYFVQVYQSDHEDPVAWVGATRCGELPDIPSLVAAAAAYADLPGEMRRTLFADREQRRL